MALREEARKAHPGGVYRHRETLTACDRKNPVSRRNRQKIRRLLHYGRTHFKTSIYLLAGYVIQSGSSFKKRV